MGSTHEPKVGQYRVFHGGDGPTAAEVSHVWRVQNDDYPLLNLMVGEKERTSVPHRDKVPGADRYYWE